MFSKIFINRPRLAMVLSIVLMLAGMLSIGNLPVEEAGKFGKNFFPVENRKSFHMACGKNFPCRQGFAGVFHITFSYCYYC